MLPPPAGAPFATKSVDDILMLTFAGVCVSVSLPFSVHHSTVDLGLTFTFSVHLPGSPRVASFSVADDVGPHP